MLIFRLFVILLSYLIGSLGYAVTCAESRDGRVGIEESSVLLRELASSNSASPSSSAAPHSKPSPPKRTIRVGTFDIRPIIDRDQADFGSLSKLVRDAFHAVSIEIKLIWIPWKRLFSPGLEAGVDAVFPMGYSEKRAAHFLFSDELINWNRAVCHLKARPFHWKSYKDFHGKVIAFERGAYFGPLYQYLIDNKAATFIEVNSDLSAFKLLLSERVDLFFCAVEEARAELAALRNKGDLSSAEVKKITVGDQLILSAPMHLALPRFTRQGQENKASLDLLALFNRGLAQVKACSH